MNADPVKARGTPLQGQLKEKWSALTDDDLEGIAGQKDQLGGKLQERYGYGKEQADREAEAFWRSHPAANGDVGPQTAEPAWVPSLSPPAHREGRPTGAPAAAAPPSPLPALPNGPALTDRPPAAAPPAPHYAHLATVWFSPRVLRWVAPVMVVALVVLLFLPWTGAYPGGEAVYTQNAFQTIWGGVSVDPVGEKALDFVKPYETVKANRLMLGYTLLVLLALFLVLGPLALTAARAQALPPIVRTLGQPRPGLLAVVALVAFLLLVAQLWKGFGLEVAGAARVDENKSLARERDAAKTPEERRVVKIHRGQQLGAANFHRTLWLDLAVGAHVLLLVGLGLELWLKRRGTLPLPRIDGRA